jgi:hypothetical protein
VFGPQGIKITNNVDNQGSGGGLFSNHWLNATPSPTIFKIVTHPRDHGLTQKGPFSPDDFIVLWLKYLEGTSKDSR